MVLAHSVLANVLADAFVAGGACLALALIAADEVGQTCINLCGIKSAICSTLYYGAKAYSDESATFRMTAIGLVIGVELLLDHIVLSLQLLLLRDEAIEVFGFEFVAAAFGHTL